MLVCSLSICSRTRAWKGRVHCARARLYNGNTLPGIKPGFLIRLHMRILLVLHLRTDFKPIIICTLLCQYVFSEPTLLSKTCASINLPSHMAFALTPDFYILEYMIITSVIWVMWKSLTGLELESASLRLCYCSGKSSGCSSSLSHHCVMYSR